MPKLIDKILNILLAAVIRVPFNSYAKLVRVK